MKKILVIVTLSLLFFVMNDKGLVFWESLFNSPDDVENVKNNSINDEAVADKNIPESSIETKQDNQPVSHLEPEIQEALEAMVNTSSEGLVEEKTDNGVSVDLEGRFQTVPVATINEAGELEIQDYSSAPKKANK